MIPPTLAPHLLDYAMNTLWQLPLLVAATWLLIRLTRPTTLIQHTLWIATLLLGTLIPLHGNATYIKATNSPVPHSSTVLSSMSGSTEALKPPTPPYLFTPHKISIDKNVLNTVVRLWLLALAINLFRLLAAWITSRRLIASATHNPELLDPAFLKSCAARLHIQVPEIRFLSGESATPVVAGILHPILLLPRHLAHDYELTAILLHEFAHIRRRDTLTNALCRLIALPIAWHPVTPLLHARITQTREILCDTLAAEATGSPTAYARSLITLARDLTPNAQGILTLGLFPPTRTSTPLEERIMNLISPAAPKLTHRAIRISAGVALITAATLAAAAFHLQPAFAAQRNTQTAPLVAGYRTPKTDWQLSYRPTISLQPFVPTTFTSNDNGATWQAVLPKQSSLQTPAPPSPAALPAPPAPVSKPTPNAAEPLAAPTPLPALLPLPAPQTAPQPAAAVNPSPTKGRVLVDRNEGDLTPAEHAQLDRQRAHRNAQVRAAIASSHFDQKQLQAKLQEQLEHLQSPEFARQMADVQKQVNSPDLQKQIAEASRLAADQAMNSEAMRHQMAHASAEIAKAQAEIAHQQLNIRIDSAKIQAEIKAATEALAHTKIPTDIHVDIDSDAIRRQIDEVHH